MASNFGSKDILINIKGENKDFKNSINGADTSMNKFSKSVAKVGPAMIAAFAVGTAAFVGLSVKMAAEEEAVNRQTESMLKSQGIMWSAVKGEVADYLNELEELTAYGDTDLQLAFNAMSSAGMDYASVMKSMSMVTDIAYTRNISLVSAADLVSKAFNGQGSSLKRYGLVIEDGISGLEALNAVQVEVNENFADATDRTDTLEGSMSALKNTSDDFMEALGDELIPEVTMFTDSLYNASGGADELATFLGRVVAMPIKLPRQLGEHTANMITMNKLRKSGVDTEEEWINLLRLEGKELADMSEAEYERKRTLLSLAGYADRAIQLDKARAYNQEMMNRAKEEELRLEEQLLAIDEARTSEVQKQLTLTQQKAIHDKTQATSVRREGSGGTTSMSVAAAAAYQSHYGISVSRDRINPNITGGNTSGAP